MRGLKIEDICNAISEATLKQWQTAHTMVMIVSVYMDVPRAKIAEVNDWRLKIMLAIVPTAMPCTAGSAEV